ncbi:TetR/AcrR family transcriptional regulator [Alcaligenaceae bacterium A4P071]|nr:TetR/AcrR family transcriptional regulator [Alcaligenaceae bacterium A4P071]
MRVRSEARRAAIVEEAAALFLETGYERASVNELARRCGGSKATLYGYFASKEELFIAVVRSFATDHLSAAIRVIATEAAHDAPIGTLLMRFAECLLQVVTDDARAIDVYRMVMAEAGRSDVGELFHRSGPSECIAALAEALSNAMQRGELAPFDPCIRARQFTNLTTAEVEIRLYQRHPEPVTVAEIQAMAERAVTMFLGGARAG